MSDEQTHHTFWDYLRAGFWPFVGGGMLFAVIELLTEQVWSVREFIDDFLESGFLTALIWVGNGVIADKTPISWVERPNTRLLVSTILTIVVTMSIAIFCEVLFRWIRLGEYPWPLILPQKTSYYISVLVFTFLISFFLHGRSFLLNMRQAIEEREALKRVQLAGRYESLKNQINPHFLFNSLNVLTSLVYKDADLSARFIRQLSDVYRYVLDVQEKEVVPLRRELDALEAYLFLLQMRFGDNLIVEQRLEPAEGEVLPPLSLQMLVENAIKHNVISARHPLTITLERAAPDRLVVRNTLRPRQGEQESLGIGLNNIRGRYQLLTDQPVSVDRADDHFLVTLPILTFKSATDYASATR